MADLVQTAANVAPVSGVSYGRAVASVTIAAGQPVYSDTATTVALADANASVTTAAVVGIAMESVVAGQAVLYATGGVINLGGTLIAGSHFFASATAGGCAPHADLATGWYVSRLGYALTTANFQIDIVNTGILHA